VRAHGVPVSPTLPLAFDVTGVGEIVRNANPRQMEELPPLAAEVSDMGPFANYDTRNIVLW
jgi:hypothetical protein